MENEQLAGFVRECEFNFPSTRSRTCKGRIEVLGDIRMGRPREGVFPEQALVGGAADGQSINAATTPVNHPQHAARVRVGSILSLPVGLL